MSLLEIKSIGDTSIKFKTGRADIYSLLTFIKDGSEKSILISGGQAIPVNRNLILRPLAEVVPVNKPEEKKSKFRKIKSIATIILFTNLIVLVGLMVSGILQAKVVLTGSMLPIIKPGDVVVTASPNFVSPAIGKVVVYTGKRFDGTPVANFSHRIIGGDNKSGWIVKGDNNKSEDIQKPTNKDISGVVLFIVPMIGKFLTPQFFSMALVFCFALWLIWDSVRSEE